MINVFAITVTYNPEWELLKRQYDTLKNQVSKVVVVDNGSHNFPPEFSGQNHKIVLIRNEKNLGLGRAQNQGLQYCISHGADFVLLLDQDSVPGVNMVGTLIQEYKYLTSNGIRVAAICPAIKNAFNNTISNIPITLGLTIRSKTLENTEPAAFAIASGSLIPVPVINKVGMIEESFFIDNMDVEWCLRATHYGYKTYITPKTELLHELGNGNHDKILQHSPFREYYIIRNSIAFLFIKYVPFSFKVRRVLMSVGRIVMSVFKGHTGYLDAQLKGFCDGLKIKDKFIYIK